MIKIMRKGKRGRDYFRHRQYILIYNLEKKKWGRKDQKSV